MQKDSENKSRKCFTSRLLLILLVILHLSVALPLAFYLNIWIDEASTLYTTRNGFFDAFQNALAAEKQAPLYFWILSLWRGFDDSVFFARLLSITFSVAAIVFFYRLSKRFFGENAALFAAAFFALHPFTIWASLEIRLYSLVILLSILILDFFAAINFRSENAPARRKPEAVFVFISVVALYTNYYLGFLLAGCFAALLVLRKWSEAKRYFWQMLACGLFFLPLLWTIKSQFAVNSSGFQTERSLAEGLHLLWNYFLTFILPTEIYPSQASGISAVSFFRLWIVRLAILTALVLLIKTRKIFDEKILAFGAICAVVAGFLIVPYFLLGAKYMAIRHAAVLFAPSILLVSLIIKQILTSKEIIVERKKTSHLNYISTVCCVVLIASFFTYSIFNLYPELAKRGDWARVAEFLQANEKPNQPIVIFPNYDALALPVYYKGVNKILPDENFFAWEFEAAPGSAGSAKQQTEFIISEIPAQANELWLLTDESCEINERCRPLENFVEANYNIAETKIFYLEKLRLLRKK